MHPERASQILAQFAREPGRAVHAVVQTPVLSWAGGVHDDASRPAASLLKLPLAMAIEPRLQDLPSVRVGELIADRDNDSVVCSLDPDRVLSPAEVLRLMLSASDNPCARWAMQAIGAPAVVEACVAAGALSTTVVSDDEHGLRGVTTARDAVRLLAAAADADAFPVSAYALRHSIRNSRIPLGARDEDVAIAHKTGTLAGVASDVARIDCDGGALLIAFLSEGQHDTLITGYEMGICTRQLLDAFGLRARSTMSVLAGG